MKKITYLKLMLAMLTLFASQFATAQCVASYTYTIDSSGTAVFTNTSFGVYDSAQWSFGDGSGATTLAGLSTVTHQYNFFGPYVACLTIYTVNGPCQSTFCDTISTNSSGGGCVAYFTVSQNPGTTSFQFTNLSTGQFSSVVWDFGDSSGVSSLLNPQHTYNGPGTYTVCLTIANLLQQCNDTYCYNVVVGGSGTTCSAQFSYQSSGSTFSFFTNNTFGLNYNWSFGDGSNSSAPNPTHQYTQTGSYVVCLTVTDSAQSCSDTYCDSIYVSSPGNCQASFSYTTINPVGGNNVQFTNSSTGSPSSWYWTFGDSTVSTAQNPTHLYAQNGTYYVCLTITNFLTSCTSTYCSYVTVGNSSGCQAYFNATPDTSNGVQFTNTSIGNFVSVYWSFGDGGNSQLTNPFHQYAFPGAYLVCLSLYVNGAICDSYCDSVIVGNPANACVPVFYSYPDSSVFGNGVVTFGVFNNCPNTQYIWSFGDSTFGTGSNPTHTYADSGWYYVCVTAGNASGTFTFCDSVYSNRVGIVGLNENSSATFLTIYPNPMSGLGTATIQLSTNARVKLDLYSLDGKQLSNIVDAYTQQGILTIPVDLTKLSNGVYLVRLNVNDTVSYQKISILK